MGFLYLLFVVAAITATALIARLASRRGVSALALSNALFAVGAVIGAAVLYRHGPMPVTPRALLFAAVGGIGGSFAVLAFNSAVRFGHFGYSNAIYRSSFLVPVVFTLLFMGAHLKPTTAGGITLILAGIFLMSCTPGTEEEAAVRKSNARWVLLILLAFLLSGGPRVGQALVKAYHEDDLLYLFLSYAIGAAILLLLSARGRGFQLAALPWGSAAAGASYLGVFFTLKALERLSPQVVFPISLSGPILLGLGLSLAFFREKITPRGWAGALLGVTGITILAIWK